MLTPSGAVVNPSCCSKPPGLLFELRPNFTMWQTGPEIEIWEGGSGMGFVSGASWRKMGRT